MTEQIKDKIDLNKVTYSVRAAQAVLQYGVGAMVDFPDQTLITAAPEYWSKTTRVYDDRFARALGVDYFALPVNISYVRFPEWYFCPKCRKFQSIAQWVYEYRKRGKKRIVESDPHMVGHMKCLECYQDLVVTRIVTICKGGHINDFPWLEWVHRQSKKNVCANPSLKFKTGASGTEGLEGLIITCSCGASATLKGAFGKDRFEMLDKEFNTEDFSCRGRHPQKHIREKCSYYPRTMQRGASSVYFPVIYSSLVIPPYTDTLNSQIEKSRAFADCITIIEDTDPDERIKTIKKRLLKWAEKISMEVGAARSQIEQILHRKWLNDHSYEIDVTSINYRAEEYAALSGEVSAPSGFPGDFSREGVGSDEYRLPHLESFSLIDKVRVVNALIGFSRINPVMSKNDASFVHIKEKDTRWYPAYEVRGEGIFITFKQNDIEDWIMSNPSVTERAKKLSDNQAVSFIGKNNARFITPKFVMLHTLSHLLIKQLSFECGYSIASLSERIYCAESSEGKQMSGIFIYTASGDSEGTLGGLVRQGRPDAFPRIFRKAISGAKICSNDPVCILSHGQGREALNLAACHACALLPETSCEERNGFLDRGLLIGTYEDNDIGFYSGLL